MGLKKAYYFSVDALLGLSLVLVGVLIMSSFYTAQQQTVQLTYAAEDLIDVMSTIKVTEINNTYVQQLIANGTITNTNNSVMEQITKFWVEGNKQAATNMARNITEQIMPSNMMFSIVIDDAVVYARSNTTSKSLTVDRELVSGMEEGKLPVGSTARIYLTRIKSKETISYAYFGGFTGQGNISTFITNIPSDANITEMTIEGDFNSPFTLTINNNQCGNFTPTAQPMNADVWSITSCKNRIVTNLTAKNNFSILFSGGNMQSQYIGGGLIKIRYRTNATYENITGNERIYLPGISGIINLYSGIKVPGKLNSMSMQLHYLVNHSTFPIPLFFSMGNKEVYNDTNSTTGMTVNFTNAQLSSILNYTEMSNTTVPIRFGFSNVSYLTTYIGIADAILVSDLSGSMEYCMNRNDEYKTSYNWVNPTQYPDKSYPNNSCAYKWQRTGACPSNAPRRIDVAINASKMFVNSLMNISGNKIGTAEYSAYYPSGTYVQKPCGTNIVEFPGGIVTQTDLTTDNATLNNHLNAMTTWYGTCICCGVNRAKQMLQNQSNSSARIGSIVIMSDGDANQGCTEQGVTGDLDGDGSSDTAMDDAVQAALDACALNYSVYTVGFGPSAGNRTLIAMACRNGTYHTASDMNELIEAYNDIANHIMVATMQAQTIVISGNNLSTSYLYPDSYIDINYTPTYSPLSFGEISVTLQSPNLKNCTSTANISNDLRVIDASVTSYSEQHWTALVKSNNVTDYNISKYGSDYTPIGDPFMLYVVPSTLKNGTNSITINTADEISNATYCSQNDSLIYTGLAKISVPYGQVREKEVGCNWTIMFDDGTNTTINIPSNYNGTKKCSYTRSSISYDVNDSYDDAVYRLLLGIDLDDDGAVYFNFKQDDIGFDIISISNVPYMWGPTKVEVRTWQ